MNEGEQTHADIEACDRALHELVSAITAYDTVAAPVAPSGKSIKLRHYPDTDLDRLTFEGLTTHPVRHALREGVKRVGREIHRLGGTPAMHDSLDRLVGMAPHRASQRALILDAAWNGIGSGNDRWWS